MRGRSLTGADFAPLLAGELGTGVLIGAALGALAYPLVWLVFGSAALAATVAVALIVASSSPIAAPCIRMAAAPWIAVMPRRRDVLLSG